MDQNSYVLIFTDYRKQMPSLQVFSTGRTCVNKNQMCSTEDCFSCLVLTLLTGMQPLNPICKIDGNLLTVRNAQICYTVETIWIYHVTKEAYIFLSPGIHGYCDKGEENLLQRFYNPNSQILYLDPNGASEGKILPCLFHSA